MKKNDNIHIFQKTNKILIDPLIDSLEKSPCLPAHAIANKLINNSSVLDHYKATIANIVEEIYEALCLLDEKDDLFVFTAIEPEIEHLIQMGNNTLAQDYIHAWLCRTLAYCALQEIAKGKFVEEYNPYKKSYRFGIGKEQYFPLLLAPSSDRPGRHYVGIQDGKYYTCLAFQNYKTFDSLKVKQQDTLIDKLSMKNLRNKIREHIHNSRLQCPFHKKKISEYPYETKYIPLEASESSIPNKNYYLEETAGNLGNILFARPTYLQLPGSPDFINIQGNNIKQVSIDDLLNTIRE